MGKTLLGLVALSLVAGCGGGGGSKSSASPFAGSYAGAYTSSVSGVLPPGLFDPPTSGNATATVGRSGSFRVDIGSGYYLSGRVDGSQQVTGGSINYPSAGMFATAPASMTFNRSGSTLGIVATVDRQGVYEIVYTIPMTLQ